MKPVCRVTKAPTRRPNIERKNAVIAMIHEGKNRMMEGNDQAMRQYEIPSMVIGRRSRHVVHSGHCRNWVAFERPLLQ